MPTRISGNAATFRLSLLTLIAHNCVRAVLGSPFAVSNTHVHTSGHHKNEGSPPSSVEFWYHLAISAVLVLVGGVCAGLTLGLMGLDELHLRVLAASSEDVNEKQNAQKVLNLMQGRRHWVLVVLLLSNVVVNESLPIFLDNALGGGVSAIILSTAAIVIFGIIPQAVSVRYGLAIGATCAPLVSAMMLVMAPITYPVARLLDWALGAGERHTYRKAELKSLLQFHKTGEEPLRDDEINILSGVLELGSKNIETLMTPLQDTFVLSSDDILDQKAVNAIMNSGYSRFPVHLPGRPKAFIGLLLVKKLLTYDPKQALPVCAFPLSILPEAHPSINCFQALDYFQTGRAHLLLVSLTPGHEGGALGVVTLEDIIEEMITEEIVDETDRYSDNQSKVIAPRAATELIMNNIVEREVYAPSSYCDETSSLISSGTGSSLSRTCSNLNYQSINPVNVGASTM
ncbi:hemolysin [Coprinopsis cinerea okayama7|uniref:Hemolysin n=1 Tax=Coprinopsis cinerea (strain Okayama-7 / 130 / ATCC MYA-4618 / FGSC 9003) TaxID=240176 RepID=A8N032_COPC7|nr:hemolysin [Coprinopsis cinerea okayama7\|eukprot:XP_001828220.2 hemolysin [Coprinopsis cinerea okayama7\